MSAEDRAVLTIIRKHSRSFPISMKELAGSLGLSGREVQKSIHRLIVDYGKNIGSSTNKKSPGYCLIDSLAESEEACESLKYRALKILTLVTKHKQIELREYINQLRLEL